MPRRRYSSGFTSVELVIVLIVLAVLTFSVGAKLNTYSMVADVAADQLIADIRYVQMKAMGVGRTQNISFQVDASDFGIYDMQGERKKLPGNVQVVATSFGNVLTYNSLGEPSTGSSEGSITLSGRTAPLSIYAVTGKVE